MRHAATEIPATSTSSPRLLENALGVDDEEPPESDPEGRDQHPVVRRNLLGGVGDKGDPASHKIRRAPQTKE